MHKATAQFAIMEDFRGNGNPDIIIGGPGGSGGTAYLTSGVNDPVNDGWLRLTNSTANQRGYAYIDKSFPSTSGVLVDFEYKIWRNVNDTYSGADGLAVFLYDATSTFQMGGYGGSLGYAPNGGNGLSGGYVGVGFDEYGNYSNPTEGRVGGPGEVPNAVVLRGPTTASASTTNPYLAGTPLGDRTGGNGAIRGRDEIDYNTQTSTRPTDAQFYRRVQIEIIPLDASGVYYQISVRWRKSVNGPWVDLISYNTTNAPPPLLKLGFGASTGGGVNFHEIRNLFVTTPGNIIVDKKANKTLLRTVGGGGSNNANLVTYTVEVDNPTDLDAYGINFVDRITDMNGNLMPEGTTGFDVTSITHSGFISATLPTAGSLTTNEITGTLNLAANSVGTITVTGRLYAVPAGNALLNTATATPPLDDDLSNNTRSVTIPVTAEGIDLIVDKTVTNSCIDGINGNTFTLQLKNNGSSTANYSYNTYSNNISVANRIRLIEVIPPGATLTQTASQYTGWTRTQSNNTPSTGYTTYTYSIGDSGQAQGNLAAGASYNPITFTIAGPNSDYTNSVSLEYQAITRWYNYFVLSSDDIENTTNAGNNSDSVNLTTIPTVPIVTSPVRYCQGETAVPLTANTTNPAYQLQWYVVNGGFASDYPFVPGTTTPGTTTYYVSQKNGDCESNTVPIQVIVYGTPTAGAIGSNQTICNNTAPAQLTSTTAGTAPGGGTISYRWESSANGTSGWTTISGANGATYQPPVLTATTYYRRTTIVTNGGKSCESVPTSNVTVTVMAVTDPGSIASDQTICRNTTPDLLTSISPGTGTGSITYRWERSNNGTSWTTVSGTNSLTYQPPSLTSSRYYRRVTIATSGATSCEAASTAIQITVNAAVTAGSIGSNQTICYGTVPSLLTSTANGTGTGTITYEWESSPNNSTWTVILGASSETYQPGALTSNTYFRRTTIATSGAACTSSATSSVLITVNSAVNAGTIGSNQTICYNTAPALLTSGGAGTGTGTITYRWESSPNGSAWTTISGTNSTTYQPPVLTATTHYRRITIATSGTPCEAASASVVITVNNAVSAGSIGSNQTICYNTTPALLTSVSNGTGTGTITYTWEWSANGTSGWTTISGATGATYQPGALTANRYYRRTTNATSGLACTSSPTASVLVTVNSAVTAGSIGTNQTICYNTAPALLTSGGAGTGTGTITYRWESSPNGSAWTTISGANGVTYQPPVLTATTHYRRVTIATSGTACEAVSASVVITVNSAVTAGSIGSSQTICVDTAPALLTSVTSGSGTGTITYRWESSLNGTSGWTTIPGATGPTYQPGVLKQTTYYRRITVATSGTACESSPTAVIAVTTKRCKVITNPMIYQRVKN